MLSDARKSLLKWVEIIIAIALVAVLVYLVFLSPVNTQSLQGYKILLASETVLVLIAILFILRGKYALSSNFFILVTMIGPWWAAFMDPTVLRGNLFPLLYTVIPVLFSGFFSSALVTVAVGLINFIGLGLFTFKGGFDMSAGASSLLFFVLFISAFSLIFNIEDQKNQRIITEQVKDLEELAVRDPLTGLNNRRFLFEFMEKEIARLKRKKEPLSLLIFDIDDFKSVNDTCGHSGGDAALLSVAESLRNQFRQSDIICRYGGDEFLIMMSGSNAENAKERATKLQQMIASRSIDHECEAAQHITISIGIATFPEHGETVDALIKAADQALYLAKRQGKNRIESA